ncbi:hypothetical protein NMK34_23925 [Micromonospora sp. BRA006-A]|uniref:hypothetical protein n=1 Tax=Micromonospora sp. BRA006-A TaxID=2962860 RepID=UPI00296F9037|nr:hypothetical protein [Micromonospora sp. BRA006-A]MDW3849667.1 hypothetical protein [Micromonospora sp. BRA006-A]MEE3918204.1 hypothetical protein [Micromonospora sp. BRA006-A]
MNLVDGRTSITGARRLSWPWQVRLSDAQLHSGPSEPTRIDGVVLIPRRRIDFMQVVG